MIEVVAGALIKDSQVLLGQRARTSHLAGYWEFPGGKSEPGETRKQALAREFMEELALPISVDQLITKIAHPSPKGDILLYAYYVEAEHLDYKVLVHQNVCWFPIEHLHKVRLAPADVQIADALIN